MCVVRYTQLENWKERRQDKKTEEYWERKAAKGPLNNWQEYQREWNFIEIDYNHQPSNNGLDPVNPAFAYDKKLAKFLKAKECLIIDGGIVSESIIYLEK